ncbi:MAG: hypothetical protein WC455_18785 [Dehalococcoidia bacterium]|jgi:hypothetical protein
MKIPFLPIGIRLPWIITIPLLLIVGIVWGLAWLVKRILNLSEKKKADPSASPPSDLAS